MNSLLDYFEKNRLKILDKKEEKEDKLFLKTIIAHINNTNCNSLNYYKSCNKCPAAKRMVSALYV